MWKCSILLEGRGEKKKKKGVVLSDPFTVSWYPRVTSDHTEGRARGIFSQAHNEAPFFFFHSFHYVFSFLFRFRSIDLWSSCDEKGSTGGDSSRASLRGGRKGGGTPTREDTTGPFSWQDSPPDEKEENDAADEDERADGERSESEEEAKEEEEERVVSVRPCHGSPPAMAPSSSAARHAREEEEDEESGVEGTPLNSSPPLYASGSEVPPQSLHPSSSASIATRRPPSCASLLSLDPWAHFWAIPASLTDTQLQPPMSLLPSCSVLPSHSEDGQKGEMACGGGPSSSSPTTISSLAGEPQENESDGHIEPPLGLQWGEGATIFGITGEKSGVCWRPRRKDAPLAVDSSRGFGGGPVTMPPISLSGVSATDGPLCRSPTPAVGQTGGPVEGEKGSVGHGAGSTTEEEGGGGGDARHTA